MITLVSWYILKVLIVSGVLCGYYFLALKDKIFHKWNRFYLLFSVMLSMILPLIRINIFAASAGQESVIKVLQTITVQDETVIELGRSSAYSSNLLLASGYILVSLFFMATLVFTIIKIWRLRRNNQQTEVNGINFINTNADGTPFSFFNSIFWNRNIDLNSISGQQILDHEIAHIREKHTYDKLFINVVLLFFWINPFFWLIRKELNMIHEFIADKIALEDDDISDFAEMILASVYPQKQFSITNNFFYSPIKRRLFMLTKNKNSKVNYVSRLFVLPLAAIVFFAFSLKMKKTETGPIYDGKTITVVIDAGHGGDDPGAKEGNINEKDLALSIAQQVKKLNENKNIKILLTRNTDKMISIKDRVQFAKDNHADMFISIHLDAALRKIDSKGVNIIIPNDNNAYLSKSKLLGSSVMEAFKNNYILPTSPDLLQLENRIYILNENQYPAIIIQAACISAEKDLAYIGKTENQRIVAENILQGIENYAKNNLNTVETHNAPAFDTIPALYNNNKKVAKVEVLKSDGKQSTVIISYADGSRETTIMDDTKKKELQAESVDIRKVTGAQSVNVNENSDKVFTKLEQEAHFPGGAEAWTKYISMQITKEIDNISKDGKFGTAVIRFIVDVNGNVSDVEATTMKGSVLAKVSVDAIKKGPKWIPGQQNGRVVNSYRLQPVTLKDGGKSGENVDLVNNKVFIKLEQEAEFPGGAEAWNKYIAMQINKDIDAIAKEGKYGTATIRFIVDQNGNVSDVEATTMKGSELAKVSVDAIKKGPKWIPGQQNGRVVNAYRLQPVTLVNPNTK